MSIGNKCYCYKDKCNQKEWNKQGLFGKPSYTIVSSLAFKNQPVPLCPYCKKKMTLVGNSDDC